MEAFIIVGLIYIGISYFLTAENADGLLAGYNTMSDERKKLYDITSTVNIINRTVRWTGIVLTLVGIVFYFIHVEEFIHFIILIFSIIPLLASSIYARLRYSKDPMRWYDWIIPIGISVGSILLTYLFITN
ncbi:DUF3784 domain-containing protein [Myroides odoratimimus]|uniref:DUF3784 domain-containing protein n=1 Tax=Myroides odoratimimus CIP 101113 TaxID=883154 RepID=A0AAV3F539_9FLAO|nr:MULTISPECIES: DUF3784 domain-containing protein [Myroides]AJA69165.1 Protein of unknown function DUF3784 [Myroides sp. A21]EHO13359.1 hypothetical protein HMPREF9714_00916 [Myroides odoratimimus CCUG 12901]EHO13900.1 hypothetical protein HMPREF9715_00974 [Myroides odoratimimus CIP 101113]MCA4791998.1 DUF3784 domain-containing protein [Myroides odoratimimus]MCA4819339.1 DUF3784 domain-containing protein [Myroides odoratimimus]